MDMTVTSSPTPYQQGASPYRALCRERMDPAGIKVSRSNADDKVVPPLARCPQCNASLPQGSSWCSLCHADLRPVPTYAADLGAGAAADTEELTAVSAVPMESDEAAVAAGFTPTAPVRGRHRRPADGSASALARRTASARLGTGNSAGKVSAGAAVAALNIEQVLALAPKNANGETDVEALSDQLVARLAATEAHNDGVPDFSGIPGGKWTVAFGGAAVLIAVLIGLATIMGMILRR